jgi:glycosyltransferase involved in cell wall biosynthesis
MAATLDLLMIAYTQYRSDARVRRAAETLAALPDYRVTVLALKQGDRPEAYELEGVRVRELDLAKFRVQSNARYLAGYFRFLALAFGACTWGFLRGRVDLVHVHNMPNFLAFAALLPRLCGRKLVLDVHDTLLETYASKYGENPGPGQAALMALMRVEEALSCRLAHRVLCVNHLQQRALVARGIPEGKTGVVLNAPDPKWFPARAEAPPAARPAGGLRLVYFGTLARRLGVDLAIRAVAQLSPRLPDLEFHVIGDGEDREELRRLRDRLGLRRQVRFHERVYPVHELSPLIRGMDLVVIPNRRSRATELMLPVKMLEGVALGLAVVAPRLAAIQHYFPDEAVFFYEPDRVEALADAIARAADDAERRRRAARARAFLAEYGWEQHRFELIDLYRQLRA